MVVETSPTSPGPARRVAVYWDFENLVRSQYRRAHGNKAWEFDTEVQREKKAQESNAQVKVAAIATYAASLGALAISRAYCSWDRAVFGWYGQQLAENFTELTQLFPEDAGKNGADISIAIDLVDDLRRNGDITDVLLCTGDGDFLPVLHVCSRSNCRLHAVGVAGSSALKWRNETLFRFLDKLDPPPDHVTSGARQRGAWAHDPIGLVGEALRQLPEGYWVNGRQLDSLMRAVSWVYNAETTSIGLVGQLTQSGIDTGLLEGAEIDGEYQVRLRPKSVAV